jgi:1,4-dihydroxy-2-naphthoate octaprenyltransferase
MENIQPKEPTGLKLFLLTIRSYAFPATVIPVIYGTIIAGLFNPGIKINFFLFFLTMVGALAIHVVSNVVNDIYDFKKGIDREDPEIGIPHGGSMVLSKGWVSMNSMVMITVISLLLAVGIGLYIWTQCGNWILYLMIFGGLLAVYYTAKPLSLKYKALGDIMVFIGFGVGVTLGSYIVQTKEFSWMPVVLSVPVGLLIIAILHSNNIRDLYFDKTFGIKTLPILVGEKLSKYIYDILIIGAYLSVIIFVALGFLPWLALLNLLTLPTAIKLVRMLKDIPRASIERFNMGTQHNLLTAKFNMQFGLLLNIGILIKILFI